MKVKNAARGRRDGKGRIEYEYEYEHEYGEATETKYPPGGGTNS